MTYSHFKGIGLLKHVSKAKNAPLVGFYYTMSKGTSELLRDDYVTLIFIS